MVLDQSKQVASRFTRFRCEIHGFAFQRRLRIRA